MTLVQELRLWWKTLRCEHSYKYVRTGQFWIYHKCERCGKVKRNMRPEMHHL